MISSPEEALLLLNKWMSESSRIVAFAATAATGFSVRIEGFISRIEETGVVLFKSGENFILFSLDCPITSYGEGSEMPDTLEQSLADEAVQWTAVLLLKYHNGERLVLCSME